MHRQYLNKFKKMMTITALYLVFYLRHFEIMCMLSENVITGSAAVPALSER